MICDAHAHILDWELSMTAWFSGCLVRPVSTDNGILRLDKIRPAIRRFGPHNAPTTLVEIENTHNMAGGTVYPLEVISEICDNAHAEGLKVHMDGARVFNAAAYLGCPVREICALVDSVMFCLSKGLGAPAGSMVAGTADAIARARLYRKRLGGGMRQAGVLAAAGLIALEQMPARLSQDHANARLLADGLSRIRGVRLAQSEVQTNILMADVVGTGMTAPEFSAGLKARGVLANPVGPERVRFVTHCDVSREDCEEAVEVAAAVLH